MCAQATFSRLSDAITFAVARQSQTTPLKMDQSKIDVKQRRLVIGDHYVAALAMYSVKTNKDSTVTVEWQEHKRYVCGHFDYAEDMIEHICEAFNVDPRVAKVLVMADEALMTRRTEAPTDLLKLFVTEYGYDFEFEEANGFTLTKNVLV